MTRVATPVPKMPAKLSASRSRWLSVRCSRMSIRLKAFERAMKLASNATTPSLMRSVTRCRSMRARRSFYNHRLQAVLPLTFLYSHGQGSIDPPAAQGSRS